MGQKPIAKLKDLPEDFEFDDPILNETVNIASDFAKMSPEVVSPNALNEPFFMRFSPPQAKESASK